MRYRVLSALLALCACALAAPALVRADEFADFRIPDNRYLQWTGSVQLGANWNVAAVQTQHDRSGSSNGLLASSMISVRDAENRWSSFALYTNLQGTRYHSLASYDLPFEVYRSRDQQRNTAEYLSGSWSERWYPGASPRWLGLQLGGSLQDQQSWQFMHMRHEDPAPPSFEMREEISQSAWQYGSTAAARGSAGYGRVRNASGVYEARVLEQRLLASGALTRPLGADARSRLAALMYARYDVLLVHDRPATIVWKEIADILRADGALRDGALAPGDAFTLVEPLAVGRGSRDAALLPVSPLVRARGALASLVVSARTQNDVRRTTGTDSYHTLYADTLTYEVFYRSGSRTATAASVVATGVSAEYHRPIGLAFQLDGSTELLFDSQPHRRGVSSASSASVGWIVEDRWLATGTLRHQRELHWYKSSTPWRDEWAVDCRGTLSYFVTDHVSASLSATETQTRVFDVSHGPFYGSPQRRRTGTLTLGLAYRFAGYANIAGLSPALAP